MKIHTNNLHSRLLAVFSIFCLLGQTVLPAHSTFAQMSQLPAHNTLLHSTPGFSPTVMTGVAVDPLNPVHFNFIINPGEVSLSEEEFSDESSRLIKYFMAALTVPEEQMWVNLSPYERDRIIPEGFGRTEMGRDMLAQDYMLKQLASSLMFPEEGLGKIFWERVYERAEKEFGTKDIPLNTFNKIWIIPEKAVVFENGLNAFVVESRLKVMLEEDYVALQASIRSDASGMEGLLSERAEDISGVSSEIVKEILIPEIEKEVNEGRTFSNLRQIYQSLILASWYKVRLRESFLGRMYVDQVKTGGIQTTDGGGNEEIYSRYLEAFQEGVYNFIKEDYDPVTQQIIPRKYFSGGVDNAMLIEDVLEVKTDISELSLIQREALSDQGDAAMTVEVDFAGVEGDPVDIHRMENRVLNNRLELGLNGRVVAGRFNVEGLEVWLGTIDADNIMRFRVGNAQYRMDFSSGDIDGDLLKFGPGFIESRPDRLGRVYLRIGQREFYLDPNNPLDIEGIDKVTVEAVSSGLIGEEVSFSFFINGQKIHRNQKENGQYVPSIKAEWNRDAGPTILVMSSAYLNEFLMPDGTIADITRLGIFNRITSLIAGSTPPEVQIYLQEIVNDRVVSSTDTILREFIRSEGLQDEMTMPVSSLILDLGRLRGLIGVENTESLARGIEDALVQGPFGRVLRNAGFDQITLDRESNKLNLLAKRTEVAAPSVISESIFKTVDAVLLKYPDSDTVNGWEKYVEALPAELLAMHIRTLNSLRLYYSERRMQFVNMEVPQGGVAGIQQDGSNPDYFYKISRGRTHNDMLIAEAVAMARLNSEEIQGVPELVDIGLTVDGQVWLRLKGPSTGQSLDRAAFRSGASFVTKLDILIQTAEILSDIHAAGLLHNDIKPHNIVAQLDGSDVQLIDFGTLSLTGAVLPVTSGTIPFYRPDETAKTPASDIYAIGRTLDMIFRSSPEYVSSGLEDLVSGMTEFEPADRMPLTMAEVADQLRIIREDLRSLRYGDSAMISDELDRLKVPDNGSEEIIRFREWREEINSITPDRIRSYLEGVEVFRGLLSDRLFDADLYEQIGRGEFGTVYVDRRDPTSVYKVAHRRYNGSKSNELILIEALSYLDLQALSIGRDERPDATSGVISRIEEIGQTIDGKIWFRLRSIPQAVDFNDATWTALPLPEKLRSLSVAARKLALLHDAGYVHNDIKPENILYSMTEGSVILTDMSNKTRVGTALETDNLGTPMYMANERVRTEKSDIFSFGMVLQVLLSEDMPRSFDVDYYRSGLEGLVSRMKEIQPGDRPSSMRDVAAELEQISDYFDYAMLSERVSVTEPLNAALSQLGISSEEAGDRIKLMPWDDKIDVRVKPGEKEAALRALTWIMKELLSNALRNQPDGQVGVRFTGSTMEVINDGQIDLDGLILQAKELAAEGGLVQLFDGSYTNKDAMGPEMLALPHTTLDPEDVAETFAENPQEVLFIAHFGLAEGRVEGQNGMGLSSSREYARMWGGDIRINNLGDDTVVATLDLTGSEKMAFELSDAAMLGEVITDTDQMEEVIKEFVDIRDNRSSEYPDGDLFATNRARLDWEGDFRALVGTASTREPAVYAVRDDNGRLAGIVLYSKRRASFDPQLLERRDISLFDPEAYIYYVTAVEVLPAFRGLGIGRKLMAHVARTSVYDTMEHGLEGYVYSEPADEDARAFHNSLLFSPVIDSQGTQTDVDDYYESGYDEDNDTSMTGKYMKLEPYYAQILAESVEPDAAMLTALSEGMSVTHPEFGEGVIYGAPISSEGQVVIVDFNFNEDSGALPRREQFSAAEAENVLTIKQEQTMAEQVIGIDPLHKEILKLASDGRRIAEQLGSYWHLDDARKTAIERFREFERLETNDTQYKRRMQREAAVAIILSFPIEHDLDYSGISEYDVESVRAIAIEIGDELIASYQDPDVIEAYFKLLKRYKLNTPLTNKAVTRMKSGLPVVTRPFESVDEIIALQKMVGEFEIGFYAVNSGEETLMVLMVGSEDQIYEDYNFLNYMNISFSAHSHGWEADLPSTVSEEDSQHAKTRAESEQIEAVVVGVDIKNETLNIARWNNGAQSWKFSTDQSEVSELLVQSKAVSDYAQLNVFTENVGGIDFNPAQMTLEIEGSGSALPLPLMRAPQGLEEVNGFVPVIINITPTTNLPLMLGTAGNRDDPLADRTSSLEPLALLRS